jgi:hypothetical protein
LWLIVYDSNVTLRSWIDFEVVGKLTAESRDFNRLPGAQAADVDASRGTDERVNFAGAVIDEDDETEWQIIDDRLSNRPCDCDKLAFGVFTNVSSRYRKRLHFRATPMSFDVSHINENEQPR